MKILKIYILLFAISCLALGNSCNNSNNENNTQKHDSKQNKHKGKNLNDLKDASSPYLRQHADNPVNWHEWGDKAWQMAKDSNKLAIVSIGYAACHWCHVMEHESFMDSTVAKVMNENFISIKVDREQRPDVDHIYMEAAHILTGRGGWPLNAIVLPDGRPVYAGTYYPKENWLKLLRKMQNMYENNPQKLRKQAKALTKGMKKLPIQKQEVSDIQFSTQSLDQYFNNWKKNIDFELGGGNGKPKFPMPIGYEYLLRHYYHTGNKQALKATTVTLNQMARGGIYDQIGGGFSRYSTDKNWKVPHFEKMLYDNAQLMSLYAKAYQVTGNPLYKKVVYETDGFIQRVMTQKDGGFFSSLNADSEGEEGKYYVWKASELKEVLNEHVELIMDYYNVTPSGNWEHDKNILHRTQSDKEFAKANNISVKKLQSIVEEANQKLLKERRKRVMPSLDDKVITSWNALMLKGYVDAYRAFNDKKFLKKAKENASFIETNMMRDNGSLYRNYKDDKAEINAFMDDYAFTIQAFTKLYQVTFEEKWLKHAKTLTQTSLNNFYSDSVGMFYYTPITEETDLVARKMEVADKVIPSSNSQMAKNLFALSTYFYKPEWKNKARQMMANVKDQVPGGGTHFANWAILMSWFTHNTHEVALVGKKADQFRNQWNNQFIPNTFLMGSKKQESLPLLKNKFVEGQTTIYVCQDRVCQRPVTSVKKALSQVQTKKSD